MIKSAIIIFVLAVLAGYKPNAQLTSNELFVEYDSAWTFRNLQLIPVRFKGDVSRVKATTEGDEQIISFGKALQSRKIKLQEMQYEQGADVNWLQVTNHSKQKVLVQAGEILGGGKQDRMIAETKFLEPGKTDYVHVYCIEKRRWDDKAKGFSWRGVANSELRKAMDIGGRQSEVWREIDRQYAKQAKTSETFSYLDLYTDSVRTDTAYTGFFTRKYAQTDSSFAGYIFITGDRIISCELFSSAMLANECFYNMLNTYIHSVVTAGSKPVVPIDKMEEFMNKVIGSEQSQRTYVPAHGKLHIVNEQAIHLIAYGEGDKPQKTSRL